MTTLTTFPALNKNAARWMRHGCSDANSSLSTGGIVLMTNLLGHMKSKPIVNDQSSVKIKVYKNQRIAAAMIVKMMLIVKSVLPP